MPRHERVPEAADGGFWLVVPAVTDDEGERPDLPANVTDWCAWYATVGGDRVCAVRTPDPVAGVDTLDVPVGAVIGVWGRKPRGRIRGG